MSQKISWKLDNRRARKNHKASEGESLFTFNVVCQPGIPGCASIGVVGPMGKTWRYELTEDNRAEVLCSELNSHFKGEMLIAFAPFDVDQIEALYDLAGLQMAFAAIPVTDALDGDLSVRVMTSIAAETPGEAFVDAKRLRNEIVLQRG